MHFIFIQVTLYDYELTQKILGYKEYILRVRRYVDRVKTISDFFTRRNYDSMTSSCQLLNLLEHKLWPDEIY
jgi:hypothetical protein